MLDGSRSLNDTGYVFINNYVNFFKQNKHACFILLSSNLMLEFLFSEQSQILYL